VWLPKAHVEAPTIGSIILAACLLKLGSYGIIRFSMLFSIPSWFIHFFRIRLVGCVLASLCCVIQWDLKALIAFSRVAHITFLLSSLFSKRGFSLDSFIFVSLSHGFRSSLLFFVFGCIYDSFGSRSVLVCRGVTYISWVIDVFIALICFSRVGFPFLLRFFGEFFVVGSVFVFLINWGVVLVGVRILLNSFYIYFLNFRLEGEKIPTKSLLSNLELEFNFFVILFWCVWGFSVFFCVGVTYLDPTWLLFHSSSWLWGGWCVSLLMFLHFPIGILILDHHE